MDVDLLQKNADLKLRVAEAIGECCRWPGNPAQLGAGGGVKPLISYLRSRNRNLQRAAAKALHHISTNRDNCLVLHQHGSIVVESLKLSFTPRGSQLKTMNLRTLDRILIHESMNLQKSANLGQNAKIRIRESVNQNPAICAGIYEQESMNDSADSNLRTLSLGVANPSVLKY